MIIRYLDPLGKDRTKILSFNALSIFDINQLALHGSKHSYFEVCGPENQTI